MVQLAFDLAGSDSGYLVISRPEAGSRDQFFGDDHYVEGKDQLFGCYDGLESLAIMSDNALVVRLSNDVPGVGREISITTRQPMQKEFLPQLRQLERYG